MSYTPWFLPCLDHQPKRWLRRNRHKPAAHLLSFKKLRVEWGGNWYYVKRGKEFCWTPLPRYKDIILKEEVYKIPPICYNTFRTN